MKRGDKYTVASDGLVIIGVISGVSDGFVEGWEMHCGRNGSVVDIAPCVRREDDVVLLREVVEIPRNEGRHAG